MIKEKTFKIVTKIMVAVMLIVGGLLCFACKEKESGEPMKVYSYDGKLMNEYSNIGDTIRFNFSPNTSIEKDGQTLYFQGYIKNGDKNRIYTPYDSVRVSENDSYTEYFGEDIDTGIWNFILGRDSANGLAGTYYSIKINKNSAVAINSTSLVVPSIWHGLPVKDIASGAFTDCTNLVDLTLPASMVSMCNCSFSDATNLKNLKVDSRNPLWTSKDGLIISKDGKEIRAGAGGVDVINVGRNIQKLNSKAFYYMSERIRFVVDANNQYFKSTADGALYSKDMKILYSATSLNDIFVIPNTVEEIADFAFGHTEIKEVSFEENSNLTKIGEYAFSSCTQLQSISLPSSVTSIPASAFANTFAVNSITVETGNENFVVEDGILYELTEGVKTNLLLVAKNDERTSIVVASSIIKTNSYAFQTVRNNCNIIFEDAENWYKSTRTIFDLANSEICDFSDVSLSTIYSRSGTKYYYFKNVVTGA